MAIANQDLPSLPPSLPPSTLLHLLSLPSPRVRSLLLRSLAAPLLCSGAGAGAGPILLHTPLSAHRLHCILQERRGLRDGSEGPKCSEGVRLRCPGATASCTFHFGTTPVSKSLCSTVQLLHFSILAAQGGRSRHQITVRSRGRRPLSIMESVSHFKICSDLQVEIMPRFMPRRCNIIFCDILAVP